MGIALVAPGRTMLAAYGRTVLWRPLRDATSGGGSGGGAFTGPYPNAIAGLSGWWDAGTFDGLLDASARPLPAWDVAPSGTVATVADKSGNGNALSAWRVGGSTSPQATPRLNGLLGGVGLNTVVPPNSLPQDGYCLPQLDPNQGFRLATADLGSGSGWTWYLVLPSANVFSNL